MGGLLSLGGGRKETEAACLHIGEEVYRLSAGSGRLSANAPATINIWHLLSCLLNRRRQRRRCHFEEEETHGSLAASSKSERGSPAHLCSHS